MSANERANHFFLVLAGVLFMILPQVLVFGFLVYLVLRNVPKHALLLVVSSCLMVLIVWLDPNYLYTPFHVAFGGIVNALEAIVQGEINEALRLYGSTLFHQPFLGYVFLLHTACILVLATEQVLNQKQDVATFNSVLSKTKPPVKMFRRGKQEPVVKATLLGHYHKTPVYVQDNARHVFVCGTTGSGKTVALSNFVEQAVSQDYPLIVVDGKGDTDKGSILQIIQGMKADKKLYVFNMSDIVSSCSYNPLKGASSSIAKDMLVSLTEWSEEHYKANTERYIQRLIQLLELKDIPLSLQMLLNYFSDDALTDLSAGLLREEKITKAEHLHTLEIIKASAKIANDASARFATIAESELGEVLSDDGVDITQAIEENAIMLFVLNPLTYPELTKRFGALILNDCKKAVSHLYTHRKERVFFLFDEINTYVSPVMVDLLNKSRSANVTCVCSTQSLADLEEASSEAFRDQIIENCNNYIVFRQNSPKYAGVWADVFGTQESLSVTYQLGKDGDMSNATGRGTATKEQKYIYHPNEIKHFKQGEGIYMSKDNGTHTYVKIRKGF